jgi:MFS family permease
MILQYLQLARGDTPLLAAIEILPMALTLMPTSRIAPRLTARFGARRVCAAGLALIAAGLAVIAQLGAHTSYWAMAAGLVIIGIGMGGAMTPATSAITEALPSAKQGVGSALNDLSREVGGAIGIAVIGSLLTAIYRSHVDVAGLPARLIPKVKASFAVATRLPAPVPGRAHAAFISGMHVSLLAAAGIALVAAFGVLRLARDPAGSPRNATYRQPA